MMDAELSHRLAWYMEYAIADRGYVDGVERHEMLVAAEESKTFNNMPEHMRALIMEAELSYTKEEFPFIGTPWPLRDK